jgi:hypothetical protein
MYIPERPIENDPEWQRLWGDDDHEHLMELPNDNDVEFRLNWFGVDEYKSFDSGLIAETRDEMDLLVDFWIHEDGLEIKQHLHNGEESDINGKLVTANVITGNPAGQYWILERGRIIGVVTEVR